MSGRSRRSNAGNRMKKLLDGEENLQEENWETGNLPGKWGDLAAELDEEEFAVTKEELKETDEKDSADSDIDVPEDKAAEEAVLGDEKEEKKAKRKNVYVDPKKKKPAKRQKVSHGDEEQEKAEENDDVDMMDVDETPKEKKAPKPPVISNRTMRATTKAFTEEVKQKTQQEELEREERQKTRKPKEKARMFTQQEILEETKKTEIKNLKSLEEMKRLEADKKKPTVVRQAIRGPKVTFVSRRVKSHSNQAAPLQKDAVGLEIDAKSLAANVARGVEEFIILEEFEELPEEISQGPIPYPAKDKCAITGLPAKYFDPLTQQPYANLYAFKILRQQFKQEEEREDKKFSYLFPMLLHLHSCNPSRIIMIPRSVVLQFTQPITKGGKITQPRVSQYFKNFDFKVETHDTGLNPDSERISILGGSPPKEAPRRGRPPKIVDSSYLERPKYTPTKHQQTTNALHATRGAAPSLEGDAMEVDSEAPQQSSSPRFDPSLNIRLPLRYLRKPEAQPPMDNFTFDPRIQQPKHVMESFASVHDTWQKQHGQAYSPFVDGTYQPQYPQYHLYQSAPQQQYQQIHQQQTYYPPQVDPLHSQPSAQDLAWRQMEIANKSKMPQMHQPPLHSTPSFPQLPQGMPPKSSLPFNLSASPQLMSAPIGHSQGHYQQGQLNYATNPNPNFQNIPFQGQLNPQQRSGQLPNPSFRMNTVPSNPFPPDRR